MRQKTCPICHTLPASVPSEFSLVPCPECGVFWTYIAQELQSEELYRDSVYAVVDNRRGLFERIIFGEARKVLKQARKFRPEAQTLLDFGAGKGQFLAMARELGWEGTGIETEKARAEFGIQRYQVAILHTFYVGGKIGHGFVDMISLNHVLEHLPDPLKLLEELLHQNLHPRGILYLEVPRRNSWQAILGGSRWMHWDIPKHLTHWTASDLDEAMDKIGFRKVGQRNFSVHLGVLGMLQAILSRVGFRDNLILRLKTKKTPGLMLLIGVLIPAAWLLEVASMFVQKSGIIGAFYCRYED